MTLCKAHREAFKQALEKENALDKAQDRQATPPANHIQSEDHKTSHHMKLEGVSLSAHPDDFIVDGFDFSTGVSICHELAADSAEERTLPVEDPALLGSALKRVLGVSEHPQQEGGE